MKIVIRENEEACIDVASNIFISLIRNNRKAILGLATGNTPIKIYQKLIVEYKNGLDFSKITTFNLDEYVGLDPKNERSFHYFMWKNLFRHVNINESNIHLLNGLAEDLKQECLKYESTIEEKGGIDLQLLGIGQNGHIGFNEPTGSLSSKTWIKILSKNTLLNNFGTVEDVPRHAITMGVGTIMQSKECLLVAFGMKKARAIRDMIEGPLTSLCPASMLQMHPNVTVVIDEAAASELQLRNHYIWIEENRLDWQQMR